MIASTTAPRRTYQPVRRDSYDVDDPRAQVFRKIEGGMTFVNAYLEVFEEWANTQKEYGKEDRFGLSCRKVLAALLKKCTDFATGICEPCIDTIMRQTLLARATVIRARNILAKAGFLDWIRRTVRTDIAPGEGPQVKQVSNAYFFDLTRLPKRALARLQQKLRRKKVSVQPDREPRKPFFAGRRAGRLRTRRDEQATALVNATSWAERAAILYPNDQKMQRDYLEMASGDGGKGASSTSAPESHPQNKDKAE